MSAKSKNSVQHSVSGVRYSIVPFDADKHVAQYVQRHRQAARIIHADIPETFAQYASLTAGVAYQDLWVCRTMITPERQLTQKLPLQVSPTVTVGEFSQVFPDENKYLHRIASELGVHTVRQVMRRLKYS